MTRPAMPVRPYTNAPEVFPLEMSPAEFAAWLEADIADEAALPCRNPQAFGRICDDQVGS